MRRLAWLSRDSRSRSSAISRADRLPVPFRSSKRAAYDRSLPVVAAPRRMGDARTRPARPAPIIAGPGKTHNRFGP